MHVYGPGVTWCNLRQQETQRREERIPEGGDSKRRRVSVYELWECLESRKEKNSQKRPGETDRKKGKEDNH